MKELEAHKKAPFSRIHGFQRPFNTLQLGSWIYFALESISFYTLVAPSIYKFSVTFYLTSQCVFLCLILFIIILAAIATGKDCTDSAIVM